MPSTAHKLARALAAPPPKAPKSPPFIMGSVAAVSSATSPPSVSVTMNGDPTVIAGVSFLDSYSPVVGDNVILSKQGTSLIILGSVAGAAPLGLFGLGASNNMASSGGVSRTATKPFLYSDSFVYNTGASNSLWTYTTSGATFHGIGSFAVVPGDATNTLVFTQVHTPTISSGNATFTGNAFGSVGGGSVGAYGSASGPSGGLIRLNILIIGW